LCVSAFCFLLSAFEYAVPESLSPGVVHFSFSAFARLSFSFCFEQMSDDVVRRVEGLGKKYGIQHHAQRQRHTACRPAAHP